MSDPEDRSGEERFERRVVEAARLDYDGRRRAERAIAGSVPRHLLELRRLAAHGDVAVRRTAVELLRRNATHPAVADLLLDSLARETDVKTRRRLAVALAETGRRSLAPKLMAALDGEDHRFVQASLILALGKLGWNDWPASWHARIGDDGPVGEALRKAVGRSSKDDRREEDRRDEVLPRPPGRYFLKVYPGAESLSAGEWSSRLVALAEPAPGWIEVEATAGAELEALGGLRTVLGDFHLAATGPPGGAVEPLLAAACDRASEHLPTSTTFRLDLPRETNRRLYRRAIQAASRFVEDRRGWRNSPSDYDLDLRLERLADRDAVLWRHRRWPAVAREPWRAVPASIHPSLAAGLCRAALAALPGVAAPRMVDPCCGGGTILAEWLAASPDGSAQGFDLDAGAVDLARDNLRPLSGRWKVERGDLGSLPLADGTADAVIANLPFGIRARHPESNRRLYRRFVGEARRVLGAGVLVAYTADHRAFVEALAEAFGEAGRGAARPLAVVDAGGLEVRVFRAETAK